MEYPADTFGEKCIYLYKDEGNKIQLKKKHKYYGQIQLGMAVLNLPECDFVCYSTHSNTFIKINIKYDENFVLTMIEKLQFNYFNNMLHEICKNKYNIP